MNFKNAFIYGEDFKFRQGGFTVENGRFISLDEREDGRDLDGSFVIPGLIDTHFHGNSGVDFSVGKLEGLIKIATYLAHHGITSFAPASMTLPEETLRKAYEVAASFKDNRPEGTSRLMGINMEGPFFSHEKRGAQAEEHLMLPDYEMFERLFQASEGLLRIVCVAPELPGALAFIDKVKEKCRVSLAHTTADYRQAKMGIEAGATQVTHLYNGMMPFLHREPGLIGAAAEDKRVSVELICDGVHVHESVIRATFQLFSADRVILVSDSLSACGMPEGIYNSGGLSIQTKNGAAVLEDGKTFAGSVTNLFQCMKNVISFGIPPEDAVRAATINPARAIGADCEMGSIATGKLADFVVCDREFNLKETYIGGKAIDKK